MISSSCHVRVFSFFLFFFTGDTYNIFSHFLVFQKVEDRWADLSCWEIFLPLVLNKSKSYFEAIIWGGNTFIHSLLFNQGVGKLPHQSILVFDFLSSVLSVFVKKTALIIFLYHMIDITIISSIARNLNLILFVLKLLLALITKRKQQLISNYI